MFEELFLSAYKQLLPKTVPNSKIPFTITRTFIARNIDAGQNFPENKKDRDRRQRTDDFSSILSDSHGHPDISSIFRFGSVPDYFRWFFPTVRKIHSSVI